MILLDKLNSSPIVPVYYNDDIEVCKSILSDCYDGGVRVFEFVDRGPQSKENFGLLVEFRNQYFKDLALGIGTIKNTAQAKDFMSIGADFLVSPIVNPAIAEMIEGTPVEWIPGCMTPSEIAVAEELGASIIKLFPGELLGPSFVKAIKPIFPTMNFIITGGVSLSPDNLRSWFNVGAKAVGVGSKLFDGEFIPNNKNPIDNLKASINFIQSL